jgi:hypothetical protein
MELNYINLLLLGPATATVSVTISNSKMFLWFREMLDTSTVRITTTGLTHRTTLLGSSKPKRFFSSLVKCHYCLNHWIAAMLVINNKELTTFLVPWLATTAIATLFSSLMIFAVWRE